MTRIPFKQCVFHGLDLNRLDSKSQIITYEERDLDNASQTNNREKVDRQYIWQETTRGAETWGAHANCVWLRVEVIFIVDKAQTRQQTNSGANKRTLRRPANLYPSRR